MIAFIKGRLIEKTPTYVVIEANGVGYHIQISLNTYSAIGAEEALKLHTQLIVREDAHLLYGFHSLAEKRLFQLLISVSGVGASTALMVLSAGNESEVQEALLSGNVAWFKAVKGIGPKSAQRIIIDLKDKIAKENIEANISGGIDNTMKEEALSALVLLGFNRNLADKTITNILKSNPDIEVEDLIKQALKAR